VIRRSCSSRFPSRLLREHVKKRAVSTSSTGNCCVPKQQRRPPGPPALGLPAASGVYVQIQIQHSATTAAIVLLRCCGRAGLATMRVLGSLRVAELKVSIHPTVMLRHGDLRCLEFGLTRRVIDKMQRARVACRREKG
jgi:hypothetical protein